MSEKTNEELLKEIDFPHNNWRKVDDKKQPACKLRVLTYIKKLRAAKIDETFIKQMISDLYWDAFVEHEMQVKESTGKTLKEFLATKLSQEKDTSCPQC